MFNFKNQISKKFSELKFKFKLLFKAILYVAIILIAKYFMGYFSLEILHVTPLTGALISATFFIFGFMLSAVLLDYKEAEKMPVEMVSNMEALNDEFDSLYLEKKLKTALQCKQHLVDVIDSLLNWLKHQDRTARSYFLNIQISKMSRYIDKLANHLPDPSFARLKLEKDNLRKNILRAKIIRETSFAIGFYTIIELQAFFIIGMLLITKFDQTFDAYFYTGILSLILIYLFGYIKDMDNPFDYYDQYQTSDEVSLEPLYFFQEKIQSETKIFEHIELNAFTSKKPVKKSLKIQIKKVSPTKFTGKSTHK